MSDDKGFVPEGLDYVWDFPEPFKTMAMGLLPRIKESLADPDDRVVAAGVVRDVTPGPNTPWGPEADGVAILTNTVIFTRHSVGSVRWTPYKDVSWVQTPGLFKKRLRLRQGPFPLLVVAGDKEFISTAADLIKTKIGQR